MTNAKTIQESLVHRPSKNYLASQLRLCKSFAASESETPVPLPIIPAKGKPSKPGSEKLKDRKRERNVHLMAAIINSIGRILAQIIGAVVGVVLGIAIAGHLSGTQNGHSGNQSLPVVPAEPQRLSQAVEYVGEIPDQSQILAVTKDAASGALPQPSIRARRVVIFKMDTDEFIVYLEPRVPR
jgi:hypothetical protein